MPLLQVIKKWWWLLLLVMAILFISLALYRSQHRLNEIDRQLSTGGPSSKNQEG